MKNIQSGFTVVEMIVVISIFSLLGGILMFDYRGFDKNQDFSVFAQEVGFLIKEQQQNAMSGKFPEIDPNEKTYPPEDWKPAYGVYLEPGINPEIIAFYDVYNDPTPGNEYEYTINTGLADCDQNPDDECLRILAITGDRQIEGIYEGSYPGGTQLSNLSVVFQRPYPDAHMKKNYQSFSPGATSALPVTDTVYIVFTDPDVVGSNILVINPTGAISIKRDS